MKKKWCAIPLLASLLLGGCTDDRQAKKVLHDMGFKEASFTGYRFFGCQRDDGVHTGFKATSPSGRAVSGVVCADIISGTSHIRLDS